MNEVQPQAAPRCSLTLLHGRCAMLFLALLFELRQVFLIDLRLNKKNYKVINHNRFTFQLI